MAAPIVPRKAVVGAAVIVLIAAGWFAMSHLIMHNTIHDGVEEALGVLLGLLILVSVIGAIRSHESDDDISDGE